MPEEIDPNWAPPTPKSSDKRTSPATEQSQTPAARIPQHPASSPPASGPETAAEVTAGGAAQHAPIAPGQSAEQRGDLRADPQWVDALNAYFAKRWVEAVDRFEMLQARYPGESRVETRLTEARRQRDIAAWSEQAEAQAKIRQADLADRYGQALNHLDQEHWQQAAELFTAIEQEQPGFRDAASLLADVRRHVEPSDRPLMDTKATQPPPGRDTVTEPARIEPQPMPPPPLQTMILPTEVTSSSHSGASASDDGFAHAHPPGGKDRGVLARYSPRAQAAISAALLIPTMVMYFAWNHIPYPDDRGQAAGFNAGFALVQGTYLIVVVAVVTRIRSRMLRVLLVAAAAVVLDTLIYVLDTLFSLGLWAESIHILLMFVYAAAWGIARRQHRKWVIGLALGLVIVVGYAACTSWLLVASDAPRWLHGWASQVGTFVVVCLVCWVCDVAGRRRDPKSPATS